MKHEDPRQKYLRVRQSIRQSVEREAAFTCVMNFPANQTANIEKWKQKIVEIKNDKTLKTVEKKQKIERCNQKIAEIASSIELFYVQHPYVKREVLTK